MILVLVSVGIITYNLVTDILKDNAEKQIEQTAIEALGRVESQFETIEMVTSLISTNSYIQNLLYEEVNGDRSSFEERQLMNQVINNYQAYTTGIPSIELYFTDYRRLFPLNELPLSSRIDREWITAAEEANGRVVWAGRDPIDPNSFLTIKKINLLDTEFTHGGYLVTKIADNYFELRGDHGQIDMENEYVELLDQQGEMITTNMPVELIGEIEQDDEDQVVMINGSQFIKVETTSNHSGWSLITYTPVHSLTQGISGIGTAILIAGTVGLLIFIIATYFLSTYITKPIQRLTHTMRFGKLGALKESPKISSTNEINELNDTYNQLVETTNYLIEVVYEKELTRSRTELKALQAQINPHFLFNTLEALYWSLEEKDEKLADIVIALSDLFRYTITDLQDQDWVKLHEEIDHIERYMQIMKLRFENGFSWKIDLDERYENVDIPRLLIQPIVENALLHGIGNKLGRGNVHVQICQSKYPEYIQIVVKDDGQGMDELTKRKLKQSLKTKMGSPSKGSGLAMMNIQQRLDLTYSQFPKTKIQIDSQLTVGTTVTMIIPKKGGVQQ